MESILTSIKKLLGIEEAYTHFDDDIIIHINSVLAKLTQLGVGPPEGFSISDATTTWNEYLGNDLRLSSVRSFVFLSVKLMFDPPSSSSAIESMNRIISEYEWRITLTTDSTKITQ